MRASVAIFYLILSPCIALVNTDRESNTSDSHSIFNQITSCVKHLDLSKCITAYGLWKAESVQMKSNTVMDPFRWQRFANDSQEEIYSKLCLETEKLLRRRPLLMNLNENYKLKLKSTGSGTFNLDLSKSTISTGRTSAEQMDKLFDQLMPLIVLPGLIMSAILPFFLPGLKMMTIGSIMLNQMALMGAVFTLLRNNAFSDKSKKKIIYINNGYGDYDHISEGSLDHPVSTNLETKGNKESTPKEKDYHLVGVETSSGITYPRIEDWLRDNSEDRGKVKNVQILGEVNNGINWKNPWNLLSG